MSDWEPPATDKDLWEGPETDQEIIPDGEKFGKMMSSSMEALGGAENKPFMETVEPVLETVNALPQIAGEAIRGAGEGEPLKLATAKDQSGFRAPSIVQRLAPSLRTEKPPTDPFTKIYQGLEGITALPTGLQNANEMVTREPGLVEQIGGTALAIGLTPKPVRGGGPVEWPAAAKAVEAPPAAIPSSKPILEAIPKGATRTAEEIMANATDAGLPPKPPPVAPPAAPPATDPLEAVKTYLKNTQKKVESNPGWQEKVAKYIKNEVADMRGKDIHLRDPMIRSLDRKRPFVALEKAEDLMTYAAEQGYFKPQLTDVARKELIKSRLAETGKNIGAVRTVGGQRGVPPIAEIRKALKNELAAEYGTKAAREIKTVLNDFDRMAKKDPSFEGLSNIATYLNGEKRTFNSIGQNEGPTIDAANIVGRMNNEYLRKLLSPEENAFYTTNLKDFGAHKKLEQMVASAARKSMTGRGAPGGALSSLWQQIWDRGGYRIGGNLADRISTSILKNPGKLKTIPDFFEELAHHAGDILDETLDIQGKAHGGIIEPDEAVHRHLRNWATSR